MIRDVLAASWLGEQLFAQLGLHRAVTCLEDPRDRSNIIAESWRAERPVDAAVALGLAGASAFALANGIRRGRWLEAASGACGLGAVGAHAASIAAGKAVGRAAIETGFTPSDETPEHAQRAQRALRVLAPLGIGLAVASIGLSFAARATCTGRLGALSP